jgi:hypothetical protein
MPLSYYYDDLSYGVAGMGDELNNVIIDDYYDDGINGEYKVTNIDAGAFSNLSLTNVEFNSFIKDIPQNGFANSTIFYINFGSVENVNPYAFKGSYIANIQINYGLKTIQQFAFSGAALFGNVNSTINLPNSVTDIGDYSFQNFQLEDNDPFYPQPNVILPKSLKNIGIGCFKDSRITGINLPSGVNVGESAFENCLYLTTANNINKTSKNMFYGCYNLQNISFETGCTGIGFQTFYGCRSLKKVDLKNTKISSIGIGAFSYGSFGEVILPNTLTDLGPYPFYSCSNLTKINIQDTQIVNYAQNAFPQCSKLNNITMPHTLKELGFGTFSSMSSLNRINFLGDAPKVDYPTFGGSNADLKLYRKKNFVTGWSTTLGGGFGQPSRPVFLWSDNVIKSGGIGKLTTKKRN